MKKIVTLLTLLVFYISAYSQSIGDKVSFSAVDGKTYTGVIEDIQGNSYKVKYDGFEYSAWLLSNQFTITSSYTSPSGENNIIGVKVSFRGTDGKIYTGVIKQAQGDNYKIKYDNYDFEAWAARKQFTILNNSTTSSTTNATTTYPAIKYQSEKTASATGTNGGGTDVYSIMNFGKQNGWASAIQENKLNEYFGNLSQADKNKLTQFVNQAKTNSAKFFVLKSWLAGDNFTLLQKFITQLNQYPENVQQEKCLMYSRRSIIQQWQQTCSVTTIQTFLGDLCPRYAWEVKQIANYEAYANDPNHPMAQQQKSLIENYGGAVSPRGITSGKEITLTEPLNDFVGKILGVSFTWQQITEPLSAALVKIRNQLDRGIDVPLNIKFAGTEARHFILAMKYRRTANGYEYLIYDPWDGVCDYVSESNLLQGSLAPLNNSWNISVDYYYPVY